MKNPAPEITTQLVIIVGENLPLCMRVRILCKAVETVDKARKNCNAALADAISVLPEQTREEILRYYFLRQPQRVIGATGRNL